MFRRALTLSALFVLVDFLHTALAINHWPSVDHLTSVEFDSEFTADVESTSNVFGEHIGFELFTDVESKSFSFMEEATESAVDYNSIHK